MKKINCVHLPNMLNFKISFHLIYSDQLKYGNNVHDVKT